MVAIILVTHGDLGVALAATAEQIAGLNDHVRAVSLAPHVGPAVLGDALIAAAQAVRAADEGVLVLTDLLGGTPQRVALTVAGQGELGCRWAIVSGVNLAMLLEAWLQADGVSDPMELAEELETIGRASVVAQGPKHG